jgi:Flp pilus assembly protein CpaB
MARISTGTMTVVIFAILVGLGGAFIVRQEMAKPKLEVPPAPTAAPPQVIVPVAATDLEPGQTLTINDIALLSFSQKDYPKSKYANLPYMRNPQQIQNRTLKMALRKGEAFMPEFLYPEGLGPGISDRLQAGYRAVTVPIQNVGAVQGFARPGTWVDVLFRSTAGDRRPEITMTLLERVEVLAINESLLPNRQVDAKDLGTVTLAVTPVQAKMLKVVEGRGELSLALRHPDDTLDLAPFNIGQLDPNFGTMSSLLKAALPVSHVETVANRVDRADRIDRVDRAHRTDANERESLEGVVNENFERVTLDDLLGLGREPPKRQMEIFLGANKTLVEFEEPEEALPPVVPAGRIRTPIAHGPVPPATRPAGQVQRTPANPPRAVVSRDRSS